MQHKDIFLASLLLISGSAVAESSLGVGLAKQAATNAVTGAAPSSVPGAASAVEAAGAAGLAKPAMQTPTDLIKDKAQEAVQQKVEQAVPTDVKQSAETVKSGAETVTDLKGKVDAVPKSTGEASAVVQDHAKHKAAGKAMDLLK